MKAFIQKNNNNEWLSSSAFALNYAFTERGYEVIPFTYKEILNGTLPLTKETIVHGGVQAVIGALKQLNIAPPKNIDLPYQLRRFCNRKVWTSTMGNIRQMGEWNPPIHVKPLNGHKLFTGKVINSTRDLLFLTKVDGQTEVLVQEVIPITSEWRCYVLNKKVIGCAPYCGDPLWFPDPKIIQEIINSWDEQINAYSIDVAGPSTTLIEINDAFSLGFYGGMSQFAYADLVEARWRSLVL